ncbi:MAG TPA: ThuA domain-containing protein [Verrucomicrobiae bacterium]|nr:ThuA domain-containing protein [Verrucomicrobiae bacterium]
MIFCAAIFLAANLRADTNTPGFKVIAFYTGRDDKAHVSFDHEANKWFPKMGEKYNFTYDTTTNWDNMNADFLAPYKVVIFLDTRPDGPAQRAAFQKYMENGGGWMGFHFSAFALTPSAFPQNWDWYHETFLGAGQYVRNTWRPTSAVLRVEDKIHPAMQGLSETFTAAPNEWYKWSNDLRTNKDISILASIDPSSFPLGTGPKLYEIWHEGYYPVVWANKNFKMVYFNMGHNDMDYEHHTNKQLSDTFSSDAQNKMIINTLLWLGTGNKAPATN